MKNKKTLRFLTFAFIALLFMFVMSSHLLVGDGKFATSLSKVIDQGFKYFTSFNFTPAYILYSAVLLVAVVVTIFWVVKLIKNKGGFTDYLQPVFFIVAVLIGVAMVAYRDKVEAAYDIQSKKLIVIYFFATGLLTVAYGIHLMVFGLVALSKKPVKEVKEVKEEKVAVVIEEKVEEPAPIVEEIVEEEPVIEEEFKEEVVEEPVIEEVVEEETEAPVVVAEVDSDGKPVRIPFPVRLTTLDKEMRDKYSELKNHILSYGVKSRVSNSADSFRAHRQLFIKVTTSGKSGLKVYYALDLNDYADSKLPLKDASGVKAFEEVPTFIYVKSDLSMKRAKLLIDDLMTKNGFVKDENFKPVDHMRDIRKNLREQNKL